MSFSTFDQFFHFRSHCLCGQPLVNIFPGSSYMEDDYTTVRAAYAKDHTENGSVISFICGIDARTSPYGEVDFLVSVYVSSNSFKLSASYPKEFMYKKRLAPNLFVKHHFNIHIQDKLNIYLKRVCSSYHTDNKCEFGYALTTSPIKFDMKNQVIQPITLASEVFSISANDQKFHFDTNFINKETAIRCWSPKAGYVIGRQEVFHLNSEKYLKYPLEREFLLNKVKTLLLFS